MSAAIPTTLPVPDLDESKILRVVSGLRPCRKGGLRLDTETIGDKHFVHNYGHGGCGITLALGTAAHAANAVAEVARTNEPIAVLGAGAVGLSAARQLLLDGHTVTVYADKAGTETVSNLAGALWLPTGINLDDPGIGLDRFYEILRISRAKFEALDAQRYGIETLPVFEPDYAPIEPRFFGASSIGEPRRLERLPYQGPPRSGQVFETLFIHTPRFLNALVEDIKHLGGTVVDRVFQTLDDVNALDERVMVNALALGSRTIFNDPTVFPAKGVLVHMEPQDLGYCAHDGYKYMFPRSDALILGGCYIEDEWDDTPDDEIVQSILAHHRRYFGLI